MKKYIDMPIELTTQATEILLYKDALEALFNRFIREIATNKHQVIKFWAEAEEQMKSLGIEKKSDEVLVFDFVTSKFYITKAQGE
jgi:hypothetical protein